MKLRVMSWLLDDCGLTPDRRYPALDGVVASWLDGHLQEDEDPELPMQAAQLLVQHGACVQRLKGVRYHAQML